MEKLNYNQAPSSWSKKLIKDIKKGDESPDFYQYYPRLFKDYFNLPLNEDKITKLSEAGYVYYLSVVLTDLLIDDKKFSYLPKIMVLQEETIKILTTIYGVNSDFWGRWNERREEYFKAVKIEKSFSAKKEVTIFSYEDLADKKAAFGKVAIDCLYFLSNQNNKSKYLVLLKSHKYFSIGFQLYDDFKDFKEDLKRGQFNWAVNQLKKRIDFLGYRNNYDTLNKLLFIKGVGQETLILSIEYFQRALKEVKSLGQKSEWCDIIKKTSLVVENALDITYRLYKNP